MAGNSVKIVFPPLFRRSLVCRKSNNKSKKMVCTLQIMAECPNTLKITFHFKPLMPSILLQTLANSINPDQRPEDVTSDQRYPVCIKNRIILERKKKALKS